MFDIKGSLVSPHYLYDQVDLDKATIDDRIAIFEDRIRGYITTPCRLLANIYENSVFLVLLAVLSSIELIEVFNRGESSRNKSKEFFKAGFRRVFQPQCPQSLSPEAFEEQVGTILDILYIQVRCGLVHTATTRSKVLLDNELKVPVEVTCNKTNNQVESIILNSYRCLLDLDLYISKYCRDLRKSDNKEIRSKFDQGWNSLCQ